MQPQNQPIYVDQHGNPVDQYGRPVMVVSGGQPQQQQGYYTGQPGYAQQPQQSYSQPQQNYVAQPQQNYNQQPQHGQSQTQNYSKMSGQGAQGERFQPQPGYHDVWAAVLFLVCTLGMLVLLFANISNLSDSNSAATSGATISQKDAQNLLTTMCVCMGIAVLFSMGWLKAMIEYTQTLIKMGIWFSILCAVLMTLVCFVLGNIMGGVIGALISLFLVWWYYRVRRRIPFAATVLSNVTSVTKQFPAMITMSFLFLIAAAAWAVVFILSYAVQTTFITQVFVLFTFYWGAQVIKNMLHVACAGTYASWYFLYGTTQMPENPTMKSLKRASTVSFGSICFGSLIVAIIKTVRAIIRSLMEDEGGLLACFVLSCLRCLDDLVQYFNHWAYAQVAIYGKTFKEAASSTWELFKSVGWEAIINDDLIDNVLAMGAVFGALLTGLSGFLIATVLWDENDANRVGYMILAVFMGLLIGYLIVRIVLQSIDSGVTTIFVCFAEDPDALRRSKPDLADTLERQFNDW